MFKNKEGNSAENQQKAVFPKELRAGGRACPGTLAKDFTLEGTVPALPGIRCSGSPWQHFSPDPFWVLTAEVPGAHRALGFEAFLTVSEHLPSSFQ